MRKTWILAIAALLIISAGVTAIVSGRLRQAAADESLADSNLPAVFKPENTPTPPPTPTQDPATIPTPPPTQIPAPSPTPGFGPNLLENGSFENGWTDLPPGPGNLTNQEPAGWVLDWLEIDEKVWDLRTIHPNDPLVGVVKGIAEMIHKLGCACPGGLPEDEWVGGPRALVLEGIHTYNMFHRGAAFGSELSQEVTLPAGTYRLTVPVQFHMHEEDKDPDDPTWDTFTAESGAWVTVGGTKIGGWATAREMGDRRWYYHVIEFNVAAETSVEILIRVKSIYNGPKDFFVDAVWLEKINN